MDNDHPAPPGRRRHRRTLTTAGHEGLPRGRRRATRAFIPAVIALFGVAACQGRPVPPAPAVDSVPPAIPDAQPVVAAPLFVGQSVFPAPMGRQVDFVPVLATTRADGGNTGVADGPAPLGRASATGSAALPLQPPLLWDRQGLLTAGCRIELVPGVTKDCVAAVNASTLAVEARWEPPGQDLNVATAVLDDAQRVIVTSRQNHLFVLARPDAGGTTFGVVRDVDLGARLGTGQALLAAVSDGSGNLWFATGGQPASGGPANDSIVGYVAPDDQVATAVLADQRPEAGFAVDQDQLYLATAPAGPANHAGATGYVYGLTATAGAVQTTWRARYDAGSGVKPGGTTRGTASPVMLLGSQFVAVTDNADDQAHLLVFLRGPLPAVHGGTAATSSTVTSTTVTSTTVASTVTSVAAGPSAPGAIATPTATPAASSPAVVADPRLVCTVGLFSPGASAVTTPPVAFSGDTTSVIVANGFNVPAPLPSPADGGPGNNINTMAAGVTRVDIAPDSTGCGTVWTIPLRLKGSPVLSSTTGLAYGYTQDEERAGAGSYVWYFVAVDFRSGRITWRQRAGAGSTKNDSREPLFLGANGLLYQAVPLGLVWMRDVAQKP